LQNTKERCGQLELEIAALESSLLATPASLSIPNNQNEIVLEKNRESSCSDKGAKVVIEELLRELEIAEKRRKELVILNQKLCTSVVTQDDSCSSLISKAKFHCQPYDDVSAAKKECIHTKDEAIKLDAEGQKMVNNSSKVDEAQEWERDRSIIAEEKLHQIIFKLEEKELQLADVTGRNICLENEVDNANVRLSALVLGVLEQNPSPSPTSPAAATLMTKSTTHSFVSHIESANLLSLVEILESIFKMHTFDEGTLKWSSSKDLVVSEANSSILSVAESNSEKNGREQEHNENSAHQLPLLLSYTVEDNDGMSLSLDNSYEVGEQNQSFVEALKNMMSQSSRVISSALEDFEIEDNANKSICVDESYEFSPMLVDYENTKGVIQIDYEEYESMRRKCEMLEAERSELLEETTMLLDQSKALNNAENVAFLQDVEKNIALERAQIWEDTRDRILKVTQKMHDRYQKMNTFRLWQLRTCRCTFT